MMLVVLYHWGELYKKKNMDSNRLGDLSIQIISVEVLTQISQHALQLMDYRFVNTDTGNKYDPNEEAILPKSVCYLFFL